MLNKFGNGFLPHVRPGTPEARLAELVDEVGGLLPALTVGAAYPILGEIDLHSGFHVYWAKIASRTFRIAALLADMRYALVQTEADPYRPRPETEPEIWS